MHGAPLCHDLEFFSRSPLPLDFDSDYFGADPARLTTYASRKALEPIDNRLIFELKLTVTEGDHPSGPLPASIEVLLVQRGPGEFCDIYQNQYAYDPTNEVDEAVVLEIDGRKVLKSYETDARTWFLTYWSIDHGKPLRLDLTQLAAAIRSATPPGALPFAGPLDLTGSHFELTFFDGSSKSQKALGTMNFVVGIRDNRFVLLKHEWVPSGTAEAFLHTPK